MSVATEAAPRHIAAIRDTLASAHGMHFIAEQMGGNVWVLANETADGAWVINGDYGVLWYPGDTRNDEDSDLIRETYFGEIDYDDDDEPILTEFIVWAVQQMTAPDATENNVDHEARARREGLAAGTAAYAEHGDLRNSVMTSLAVTTAEEAFPAGGDAVVIFGSAFVNGYTEAQYQATR